VHSRAEFEQTLLPLAAGTTAQVDVISGDGTGAHTLSVPFTDFKAPVFIEQACLGIEVEEDVPDFLIGSLGQVSRVLSVRELPTRLERPHSVRAELSTSAPMTCRCCYELRASCLGDTLKSRTRWSQGFV
jgi:hypothetical protein